MPEVLVILAPSAAESARQAVMRAAPAAQMVSDRVYTSVTGDDAIATLASMPGVAAVLRPGDAVQSLPPLNDAETLFAQAWLSRAGQTKQRPGDGLSWDAPGMTPPDPPRRK